MRERAVASIRYTEVYDLIREKQLDQNNSSTRQRHRPQYSAVQKDGMQENNIKPIHNLADKIFTTFAHRLNRPT